MFFREDPDILFADSDTTVDGEEIGKSFIYFMIFYVVVDFMWMDWKFLIFSSLHLLTLVKS